MKILRFLRITSGNEYNSNLDLEIGMSLFKISPMQSPGPVVVNTVSAGCVVEALHGRPALAFQAQKHLVRHPDKSASRYMAKSVFGEVLEKSKPGNAMI